MDKKSPYDIVFLENLTWVEAEEVFRKYDVVMIPLGARTKEHGPHLPLNNDWVMAEYLCERVAMEVPVIIMPTLQFGYYPSFLEYPGSVSLERETFTEVITQICKSISGYGIKKYYILNTGISTLYSLKPASDRLKEEGIILHYTNILKVDESILGILEQEYGSHADESETSMMLYIKPEIVDMSKAVKDINIREGKGLTRNPEKPGIFSKTGIFGDPTLATREKGEILTETLIKEIIKEINNLIKLGSIPSSLPSDMENQN